MTASRDCDVSVTVLCLLRCAAAREAVAQKRCGIPWLFEDRADVGEVMQAGSVEYDAGARSYIVTGSGANVWSTSDAFHFAWKKVSGDVTLTADASVLRERGNAHRKAVLMVRQSLDADSAYADAALHADGLTSL